MSTQKIFELEPKFQKPQKMERPLKKMIFRYEMVRFIYNETSMQMGVKTLDF